MFPDAFPLNKPADKQQVTEKEKREKENNKPEWTREPSEE